MTEQVLLVHNLMLMLVLITAKIVHNTLTCFMHVSEHKQQRTTLKADDSADRFSMMSWACVSSLPSLVCKDAL